MFTHAQKLCAGLLAAGLVAGGALAGAPGQQVPPKSGDGKLIVHEWGTFLSVQGSDGTTLGGMVDSEERLPNFVRERELDGGNRACWCCKMETPVTYFYVDRPRKVEVRVDMPQGVLTHWFPAVQTFGPPPACKRVQPVTAGTFLDWGPVELVPGPQLKEVGGAQLRLVGADDPWRFARETDAALVHVTNRPHIRPQGDLEKFLFYRGVGTFKSVLEVHAAGPEDDLRLTFKNASRAPLQGMFAVWVDRDTIRFGALPALGACSEQSVTAASALSPAVPLRQGVPQVKQAVAASLAKAGLYTKEAQAMVNTWEKSYFRTEGLRILYTLPRGDVDGLIPIRIKPAPQELVRVMVGRVEVLTPSAERRIERAVRDLGVKDPAVRKAATDELNRWGRFQEPALHRIVALTTHAEVRARAEALIKSAVAKP